MEFQHSAVCQIFANMKLQKGLTYIQLFNSYLAGDGFIMPVSIPL